ECIRAVSWFYDQLTPEFRNQVVCYSASSDDDISCILSNGVEVSFGQVRNVDTKESVAKRILDEFGGQVTYINVRVPSHPTYRRVNSTYVREGSGATGSLLDEQDTVQKERAYTSESGTSNQGQDEQNLGQEEYTGYEYTGDESGLYSEYDYGYEDYGTGQYDTSYV
nr:cell division protein FtsQ/DivIB [Olsenella sp.]